MLVSHSAKFIFVHVQKTGGMSMTALLKQHFPDAELWHGRHGHARDGLGDLGRDRWDEYFSFAVVRNPWDRLVSWYSMIRARQKGRFIQFPWPFSPHPRLWDQVARKGKTFEEFLENCTAEVFDRGCWKSFAYNQIDYLLDEEGRVAVNDVCRFEHLHRDSREVLGKLGVYADLPHHNASSHSHYSTWYDQNTEALVRERFARDIEAFGYTFDRK